MNELTSEDWKLISWAVKKAVHAPSHTPPGRGPNADQPIMYPYSKGRITAVLRKIQDLEALAE